MLSEMIFFISIQISVQMCSVLLCTGRANRLEAVNFQEWKAANILRNQSVSVGVKTPMMAQ